MAGSARILEREPIPDEPWRNIEYDGACWDGKLSDLRMMRMFSTPRRSSPECYLIVLLIDERPEEVTDWIASCLRMANISSCLRMVLAFLPARPDDIYVSPSQIGRFGLTDAIVLQIRINPTGKRLGQAPQHPAPCMDHHGG